MIFKSLTVSNFMNLENVYLDFIEGLNVFVGGNGEGKSAVINAIAFSLFEFKRGDSFKDFIMHGKNSMHINLNFYNKNIIHSLDVNCFSDKNTVEKVLNLYDKNGKLINTFKNSEVSTFINSELNSKIIENVLFSMQMESPITKISPFERKRIFLDIFNLNFDKLLDHIQTERQIIQSQIISVSQEIKFLTSKIDSYVFHRIKDVSETEISKIKDLIEYIKNEIKKYYEIVELLNEVKHLETKIDSEKKLLDTYYENINSHKTEINQIDQLIEKLEIKKKEIENNINDIYNKKLSFKEKYDNILNKKKELEEANSISFLEEEENKLQGLIKWKKYQIKLYNDGKCSYCGQECDTNKVPDLNLELNSLINNLNNIKEKINKYNNEKEFLNKEYSNLKVEESNIDITLNYLNLSIKDIENEYIKLKNKKTSLLNILENLNVKYISIDKKLKELIEEYHEKQNLLNKKKDNFSSSDLEKMEKEIKELMLKLEELNNLKQKNDFLYKVNIENKTKKMLDENKKNLLVEELNKLNSKLNNYNILKTVFETEFPSFVIYSSCEYLENYMNSILFNAKSDIKISLKPTKKGIEFFYDVGNFKNLKSKMASGFETCLLDFAFKSSIAKIYDNKFLVLDEPDFAASEDSSLKFFESMLNIMDDFDQIFLITHKSDVVDFIQKNYNSTKVFYVKNGNIFLEN